MKLEDREEVLQRLIVLFPGLIVLCLKLFAFLSGKFVFMQSLFCSATGSFGLCGGFAGLCQSFFGALFFLLRGGHGGFGLVGGLQGFFRLAGGHLAALPAFQDHIEKRAGFEHDDDSMECGALDVEPEIGRRINERGHGKCQDKVMHGNGACRDDKGAQACHQADHGEHGKI